MNNIKDFRNNKKTRLIVMVALILVAVILYFRNVDTSNLSSADGIKSELSQNIKPDTIEKKVLLGIISLLGLGVGMEANNTDYDLGKVIQNKSFAGAKVLRDKEGNIVTAEEVASGAKVGKGTDEYNCADFKTQPEAQNFYNKAGGVSADTNRLDGDKDGTACQALPKK